MAAILRVANTRDPIAATRALMPLVLKLVARGCDEGLMSMVLRDNATAAELREAIEALRPLAIEALTLG